MLKSPFFLIGIFACNVIFPEKTFEDVSINEVEKFWDNMPCNIHYTNGLVYKNFFDEAARLRYKKQSHISSFAEFERWRGKKVLEIGCGIGTEAINFAQAGAVVTAIDLSGKSIEITKKRFDIYGLNARLIHGNSEELDKYLGAEKFDLIWSHGVIHHSPHPEKIIEQCKNFLNPNGELRIMLYAKISAKVIQWMINSKTYDLNCANELAAVQGEYQQNSPVTYTYTFASIRRLLHDFDIIDMRKVSIRPHNFFKNISESELKDLEEELGWFILVRAKLRG